MLNNNHKEIFQGLSEKLGCELVFDEQGICELTVGEEFIVTVASREDDGLIILSSVVAPELPDPVDYPLVLDLLNFGIGPCVSGGGNSPVISRDPETGLLVAYEVLTASVLASQDITELFTGFLDFCIAASQKIAGAEEQEMPEDSGEDTVLHPDPAVPPSENTPFMEV